MIVIDDGDELAETLGAGAIERWSGAAATSRCG